MTRPRPHIDRIASAWLIKRFCDPDAKFAFADAADAARKGIPFDVLGADFGHHGEDCTFETLVKRFGIKDQRVKLIAEIVHEADLHDGKFTRNESTGVDLAIRALAEATPGRSRPARARHGHLRRAPRGLEAEEGVAGGRDAESEGVTARAVQGRAGSARHRMASKHAERPPARAAGRIKVPVNVPGKRFDFEHRGSRAGRRWTASGRSRTWRARRAARRCWCSGRRGTTFNVIVAPAGPFARRRRLHEVLADPAGRMPRAASSSASRTASTT